MKHFGLILLWLTGLSHLGAQTTSEEKILAVAYQKIKAGKSAEALLHINQLLNVNPKLAEAYTLRGRIKENSNEQDKALTDYGIVVELSPTSAEGYLNRGVLAYKLKRFDLAKSDFQKLLTLKSTETNMVYFRQSNNEGFDKIFTVQSGIQDLIYNYLGLIATEIGMPDRAVPYFDSAIHINPRVPDYVAHRGLAYLKQGNDEKAKSDFYTALSIDPNHAVSKNNLAVVKRQEGDFAEAEKFLMEAKKGNNKSPNHYADLGLLQLESKRYQEAILNLDTAIVLSPTDGELFINRGLAKEKSNDLNAAFHDFEIALQIDPRWPKAWFVQGNIFMKKKQWAEALENYSIAITYDENYALAYYNRAIVHNKLGQNEQACKDIQKAEATGMTVEDRMRLRFCGSN